MTQTEEATNNGKNYPCAICNAPFATNYLRANHGRAVHPRRIVGRAYVCKVPGCGKEMSSPREFGKHMRADHPTIDYAPSAGIKAGGYCGSSLSQKPQAESALDRILDHKKGIMAAVRDLDAERDKSNHNATTKACLIGEKHRVVGFTQYSAVLCQDGTSAT